MPTDPQVVLLQDSREQRGYQDLFTRPCVIQTLTVGDYSVAGVEHMIAIERKTLPDLVNSLTHERARFERELAKTRSFHRFFVVVEADFAQILRGFSLPFSKQTIPQESTSSTSIFSSPNISIY